MKNYIAMIDGQNFSDELIRNNLRTFDSIWKIAKAREIDYATGCLLDHYCFESYYRMAAIDVSKPQAPDVDPKAI